jgi:hypothetical protein
MAGSEAWAVSPRVRGVALESADVSPARAVFPWWLALKRRPFLPATRSPTVMVRPDFGTPITE